MKIKFILLALLFTTISKAQVGIGNDAPKVTLDISGNPDLTSSVDGLLIPRVTGDELRAKNSIYTNVQHSTLVFVTESDSNPSGKTIKITEPGYYYYSQPQRTSDGVWVRLTNDNHWKVQNTSNSATANTDNIYQKGKVAIGFDSSTSISEADLEVKGIFYTSDIKASGPSTQFLMGSGIGNMIVSEFENTQSGKYSSLNLNKEQLMLANSDGNKTSQLVLDRTVSNGNSYSQARLVSAQGEEVNAIDVTAGEIGTANSFAGGIKIHTKTTLKDRGIYIQPDHGIRFTNNKDFIGGGSYEFPTGNGSANQILVTDGNSVNAKLSWKNISDITSPTSPRYFYFPTLSLPITNSVNSRAGVTYNQADGTYQVDLFEILRNQMANPVASSNASSDYLSELVLQRDKYEYFVIEANQQVFKNISFLRGNGNEGKLVYKVNPVDNTSNSETMNIIIKQKQ